MKNNILKLMCCPKDGSDLHLYSISEKNENINSGLLVCSKCEDAWTVIHGIPRFVSASSVDLDLEHEFLALHHVALDIKFPGLVKSMQKKLGAFEETAQSRGYDWNEDELLFWEENYNNRFINDETNRTTFNRLLPRQKFILDLIKNENISTILEVGCGTCGTLYHSGFPMYYKQYVGTDISFNALRVASKFLDVNLVMCDAMNLPFKDESFDLLLSFGLMHHLEQRDQSLNYFYKKIKIGGYIGFTEKLKSKFDFGSHKVIKFFKDSMNKEGRGHGDEEYIDEVSAISIARKRGVIISERFEYSIVRDILTKLLLDKLGLNNKTLTRMIMKLDYFTIDYLGWMSPLLKGHSLIMLARREDD